MTTRKCRATARSGQPCKMPAMIEQQVCRLHGGKSPQALAAAQVRLVRRKALSQLEELGGVADPVGDPIQALEGLAAEVLDLVSVLRAKISKLKAVGYESSQGIEQTKAEIAVYLQSITRAESILKSIINLDLEGRKVRIQEAQVAFVLMAFTEVMNAPTVGLTADGKALARKMLADRFMGVTIPGDKPVTRACDQGECSSHLIDSQTVTE